MGHGRGYFGSFSVCLRATTNKDRQLFRVRKREEKCTPDKILATPVLSYEVRLLLRQITRRAKSSVIAGMVLRLGIPTGSVDAACPVISRHSHPVSRSSAHQYH